MSGGEKKRNSTLKFRDLKIVFPRGHTFTFWKPMLISFGLHNRGKKTLYSIFRNPYLQRVNVLTREYYLSLTNIKKFRRKFFYCLATGSPYLIHIYNYKGLFSTIWYMWKMLWLRFQLITVWFWVNYFIPLGLIFLIGKQL